MVETAELITLAAFVDRLRPGIRPVLAFKKPGADRVIILLDAGEGRTLVWDVGP